MEYSIIKEKTLHHGGLNRIDDFKNSIVFDKFYLMESSMSIEKVLKNVIFG